jgi:hypothetical protein
VVLGVGPRHVLDYSKKRKKGDVREMLTFGNLRNKENMPERRKDKGQRITEKKGAREKSETRKDLMTLWHNDATTQGP